MLNKIFATLMDYFKGSAENIDIPVIFQKNIYRATNHKKDLNPYDRYEYFRPKHKYLLGQRSYN